jgi:hypothetical protein
MPQQLGLQILRINGNLASRDFGVAGPLVAQLADRQRFCTETDDRAEGAASDGPRGIEVACAGGRIEGGTRLALGRLVAGEGIAKRVLRTFPAHPFHRSLGALANPGRTRRVERFEIRQSCPQTDGIELGYAKGPDAALETAGPADEPGAAPARGFSHGSIYDLDEVGVGWHLD